MPAIVDFVRRFGNEPDSGGVIFSNADAGTPQPPTPPPDRLPVLFQRGAEAILDLTHEKGWLSFGLLRSLRQFARPAHVEIGEGRVVTRVLIPIVTRVRDLRPIGNGTFHVRLQRSNCRHVARASSADERERIRVLMEGAEKRDLMAVTSDPEEHVILNVERFGPSPPQLPEREFSAQDAIDRASPITEEKARELFASITSQICQLPLPRDPNLSNGLPFQYPDDACWAVADKVFELIESDGVRAGKIWLFDGEPDRRGLRITTPNRSGCFQVWDWHVAAFVKTGKTGIPRILVLDPVAFLQEGPLDRDTWGRKLGKGRHGQLDYTSREVYSQAIPQDPNYVPVEPGETEGDLVVNLRKLADRSGGNASPPPYSHCSKV